MADTEQPNRSQADKERSRQQSRAVSGKEAAKGVSGRPGGGQTNPRAAVGKNGAPAKGGGSGRGAAATKGGGSTKGTPAKGGVAKGGVPKGGGQRPARPGNRPAAARGPRRSSTALLTWGVVGLVLIIVIVLVVVKLTSGSSPGTAPTSQPLPANITQEVTNIPASVYDTVGISSPTVAVSPPKVLKGKPLLTFDGQPGLLYFGAEYCPYCAAERWAITASLSRFGKFTGLGTMQSSSTDVYPSTQTLTYAKATFTSQYIVARLREYYSNVENSSGTGYELLNPLTKTESKIVDEFDISKYTGATSSTSSSHSFPFMDIGNKALVAGASYSPAILAGLTRAQIAGSLTTTKDPVTRAIIATSNYLSAATCATDGDQPAAVCTSKGVTAAAKALGFKS